MIDNDMMITECHVEIRRSTVMWDVCTHCHNSI